MKPHLQRWIQGRARSLGYELQPVWKMRDLPLSAHLRQLFDLLKIDTVLDVGANMGQYHDFLRKHVGFTGTIVSFEPVRKCVAALRESAASDPHWKVVDVALGSADTTMTINVMKCDDFSSFLEPAASAPGEYRDMNAIDHQENVPVRRLDGILGQLLAENANPRLYLKLDTQGFDLQVVEGTSGVLDCVYALQTEIAVQRIYDGMPDYLASIQTLNQKGFQLTGLFPVSRDASLRLVELDCVMINAAKRT